MSKKMKESTKGSLSKESLSDVKNRVKNINNDKDNNNDKNNETSTKQTSDYFEYLLGFVVKIVTSAYAMILPVITNNYNTYIAHSKPESKTETEIETKTDTKSKKTTGIDVDTLVLQQGLKNNMGYLFLAFEIYSMLFHYTLVRFWIFANFVVTLLHMYNILSDPNIKKRLLPIGTPEIKKYSGCVIILGVLLLFFATSAGISMLTIPLILYLLNRTTKNVFGRGF